jgi:hypothetical protein
MNDAKYKTKDTKRNNKDNKKNSDGKRVCVYYTQLKTNTEKKKKTGGKKTKNQDS